jgi:hypothetical protein
MEATLEAPDVRLPSVSNAARRGGWALTALPVLFMGFDAVIKFAHIPAVAEASAQLG